MITCDFCGNECDPDFVIKIIHPIVINHRHYKQKIGEVTARRCLYCHEEIVRDLEELEERRNS